MSKKIYLAISYSNFNKELSFEIANKITAKLMNEGNIVFSPISHCHPISISNSLPGDWNFWKKFDESFIKWCEEVYVVLIQQHDGVYYNSEQVIKDSEGVNAEMKIAQRLNKSTSFFTL